MKYFYIAVTVKQDKNENVLTERTKLEYEPGYYSYVARCTEMDNLQSVLSRIGGLIQANMCGTKKRAAEIVTAWNAAYKANGTYLFDNPSF